MTDNHRAFKNGVLFLAHDVVKIKVPQKSLWVRLKPFLFSNLEYTMIIVPVAGADYSVTDKSVFTKILVSINTIVIATGQLHESSYLN